MGRKIASTAEATEGPIETSEDIAAPAPKKKGATFVCNFVNQKITFRDKTTFTVTQSRFTVTDESLIANLREVAEQAHLFEVTK